MEENKEQKIKEMGDSDNLKEAMRSYVYPLLPKRNNNLRNEPQVSIISNLFPIEYIDSIHKLYLYSIEILPTIADDNFPLKRVIYQKIESLLPEEFKKVVFAGNNLYVCVANYKQRDLSYFELSTSGDSTVSSSSKLSTSSSEGLG